MISEKELKERQLEGRFIFKITLILYSRYGVFHQTIEMYLNRHWRAYTIPRVAVFWFGAFGFMQHGLFAFLKTFPNLLSYEKFSHHPNYKLMGPIYAWFYVVRPIFWTYVFVRLTRLMYYMVLRHLDGKGDLHYHWYYDTLYPDMFFDEEDMRYINFRYTDAKVVPDPLTGYYPYDNMKYGGWLNQKSEDALPTKVNLLK